MRKVLHNKLSITEGMGDTNSCHEDHGQDRDKTREVSAKTEEETLTLKASGASEVEADSCLRES